MITRLRDQERLLAVSPMALSAYASSAGWVKTETFGAHSDVYSGTHLPEIIVPRTQNLGDYTDIVDRLISIFADVADVDELTLYNDLLVSDRDVIRARADNSDSDGSIDISAGANLISGARDMLLAAACSLDDPRALYRIGANRDANEMVSRVKLGQTERGSYVVTLLTSAIPPSLQVPLLPGLVRDVDPSVRRLTRHLARALTAVREATERATVGYVTAFEERVPDGTSANLCEAVVQMVEPFPSLDVSMTWARTRPMPTARDIIRFSQDDIPILREAARTFRIREPKMDTRIFGYVQRLKRGDSETDGTVTLRASIDGNIQSVIAVLSPADYNRAIEAHQLKAPVIAEGDLDRFGQRWHLVNPRIAEVIHREPDEEEDLPSETPTTSEL